VEEVVADFENSYDEDYPADITVDITAKKTVQNLGTKEIGPEGFEFVLKDTAVGGSELKERSDEAGLAEFQLSYSWEDIGKVFNYTLTETDEGADHVTYSDVEYAISVAITLDEVNNKLVATITKDGTPVEEVVADFENSYDEDEKEDPIKPQKPDDEDEPDVPVVPVIPDQPWIPSDPPASNAPVAPEVPDVEEELGSPQTGDNSRLSLWLALLCFSGFGLLGSRFLARKAKKGQR